MAGEQASATGVTFQLADEDHTLANALRFLLNKKYAAAREGRL